MKNNRLSTYETKLRDAFKLRKKLKSDDWGAIHHHAQLQGYAHGGYEVYLNDTRIPWQRVWKEIRRNGFHNKTHNSRYWLEALL